MKFKDVKNEIIGCIHAGWKGALNGIIENTINKFRKLGFNNVSPYISINQSSS